MTAPFLRVALTAACFACLSTLPVYAQDDAFKRGMDARDDEKWPEMAKFMRAAIDADSKESLRKVGSRLGFGGDEYLPFFYLGEALFNDGQCGGALNAWDQSESQKVVQRVSARFAILRKGTATCEMRGFLPAARLASEMERAAAAIREAAAAEQAAATLRSANADAVTPDLRATLDKARTDLAGAREKAESARNNRRAQEIVDAVALAETARRGYVSARSVLDKAVEGATRFRNVADEAQNAITAADRSGQLLAGLLSSSEVKLSLPTALADTRRQAGEALAGARDRLAAARRSRSDNDVAEARRLAVESQSAFDRVRAAVEKLRQTEVDRELRALRASAGAAFTALDARIGEARTALADRPPAPASASKAAADLKEAESRGARGRARFEQAVTAGDLARARTAAAVVTDLNARLDAIHVLLGGPALETTVPEVLKAAAQAFFDARYRDVIGAIPAQSTDGLATPLRVHAHVLRSAASFALYEYSGGRDAALLTSARQEAEAAKSLAPSFQPNPAAFPPKFLTFYAAEATKTSP